MKQIEQLVEDEGKTYNDLNNFRRIRNEVGIKPQEGPPL